ncbi:tetratricopeptide repeat protein, partial [Streptomyces anulatus]
DPTSTWPLTSRGLTYRHMRRLGEASVDFTRAIELNPENASAVFSRGVAYRLSGRHEEALADFTRAIELDPDNMRAFTARGNTYRLSDRHEEALADLTRAIELDPDNAQAFTARGNTYRLSDRHEEALADLTRAIELDPGNAWSHYELAIALNVSQNPGSDAQLMQSVILLSAQPTGTTQRTTADTGNLFLTHCAMSRWEEAGRYLEDFTRNAPALGEMNELIAAMNSLSQAMPSTEERLSGYRLRLEEVVADL